MDETSDFSPLGGTRSSLDNTPRKLFLLTGFAVIGGFLFGYDTGVVSGAMLLIRREMELTDTWHQLMVSATIASALVTALASGQLADRFGRRPTILIASLLFGLGSSLMAVATGKITLLVGRIFVGIGVGFASSVVPLYLGECSTAKMRGVLVAVNIVAVTLGQLVAGFCCGIFLHAPSGWRLMLGLATLPALFQLIGGLYFIPESPRYLVKMGLFKDAEDVLASIRSPTHLIQDELEDIRISCNNISSPTSNQNQANFISNLLSDRHARKSVFLGCLLQFCQQLAGINTVMYYAASIVKMTGASDDLAVWFSCVTAGINFIFSLVGLKLVNLLSRRKLLFISLGCVIISLLSISASFQYLQFSSSSNHSVLIREIDDSDEKENPDNLVPSLTGEIIVLISIALYIASFAPGLGPLPWTINSELHPAWCRAQAQGLATSVNWTANLMVSMTFLSLVSALGRPLTFLLYAAVTILCSAVLGYQLPETKGVSLEEVGALFSPSASTPRSGDVLYSLMSPSDEDSQNER